LTDLIDNLPGLSHDYISNWGFFKCLNNNRSNQITTVLLNNNILGFGQEGTPAQNHLLSIVPRSEKISKWSNY